MCEKLPDNPDYVQFHIPGVERIINFRDANSCEFGNCGNCKEVRLEFNVRVCCQKLNIEFPHVKWFATDYRCDYYR